MKITHRQLCGIAAGSSVAGLLLAASAHAGGLDRTTYSPSILFEEGNYIEASFARVDPDISADRQPAFFVLSPIRDMAPAYTQIGAGIKLNLGDMLAVAFQTYDAVGADVSYNAPLPFFMPPTQAHVSGRAYVGSALLRMSDNFSVYGGIKYQEASGNAAQLLGIGDQWQFAGGHGIGYIMGAAFEKKEYAMRVSFTYETAIDFGLATTSNTIFGNGVTTARIPEAWELYAQSGIAPGTLLFGSIRHSAWSKANLAVLDNPLLQLTDFSDSMTYTLGVGRALSERLSVSLSGTYEPSDGKPSTLQPVGDKISLAVGAKIKLSDEVEWSGGVSHTWLGDNTTAAPLPPIAFTGSHVWAFGTKIGLRF